jgi:hypothetical protein
MQILLNQMVIIYTDDKPLRIYFSPEFFMDKV